MDRAISSLQKMIKNAGTIILPGIMDFILPIKIENIMNQYLLIHLIILTGNAMQMAIQ